MKSICVALSVVCLAGMVLAGDAASSGPIRPGALVLRFDDNKPVSQWRELAEIFEAANGRCSFAVNSASLSEEQWKGLRELSARGHEVMDHTGQHAVFALLLDTLDEVEKLRGADFFDHAEGRRVLCRPELDLSHPKNVRVQASMTNGLLRSDDPAFLKAQGFSRKFYVPSTRTLYGMGRNCGAGLFKKGPEQKCSDFWGRWTTNSFATCEIVLLDGEAVQPSKDLLRAQARTSVARFKAHGLPTPKTWIRPGGWETSVDWRRMKEVYGDEFGYKVADSTCGVSPRERSAWHYPSDFAFFDQGKSVDEVYGKAVGVIKSGRSFAYISHQWTKDRAKYLEQCRGLAAKLKENGIRITTYCHVADMPRKLVWSDEFDGKELDQTKWRFRATMNSSDCVYTNDARTAKLENGCLHLTVLPSGNPEKPQMLSRGIATHDTMGFKYGYLEMRAKVPFKHGAWPSWWMTATPSLRKCDWMSEIDIFEVFSSTNEVVANLHKWGKWNAATKRCDHVMLPGGEGGPLYADRGYRLPNSERLNDEFHVYGYEWTPETMSFFVDGVRYYTVPIDETHDYSPKPMKGMAGHHDFHSVIFNNEIFTPGHGWCPERARINPEDVPIDYWIDWIRLYQKDGEEIRVLTGAAQTR